MRALLLLLALGGCAKPPPKLTSDAIFASVCARCHGAEGFGGPPLDSGVSPRNFHDAAFQSDRTDAQLRAAIIDGKNGQMPSFGDTFTDEALDGLVAQVRSFNPSEASR